jgi:hypothetical protein
MLKQIFGLLLIIYQIYWLFDGGAKYLGAQGYMLAAMGIIVGLIIMKQGEKASEPADAPKRSRWSISPAFKFILVIISLIFLVIAYGALSRTSRPQLNGSIPGFSECRDEGGDIRRCCIQVGGKYYKHGEVLDPREGPGSPECKK